MDLNQRPHAYQACALTNWAIGPYNILITWKTKSFKTKQNKQSRIKVNTNINLDLYLLQIGICTSTFYRKNILSFAFLLRKEVIHPHVLVGIPCYDFTPIICPTLDGSLLSVKPPASGITNSHGVTGGVYKTRERIHRDMLIHDY